MVNFYQIEKMLNKKSIRSIKLALRLRKISNICILNFNISYIVNQFPLLKTKYNQDITINNFKLFEFKFHSFIHNVLINGPFGIIENYKIICNLNIVNNFQNFKLI